MNAELQRLRDDPVAFVEAITGGELAPWQVNFLRATLDPEKTFRIESFGRYGRRLMLRRSVR